MGGEGRGRARALRWLAGGGAPQPPLHSPLCAAARRGETPAPDPAERLAGSGRVRDSQGPWKARVEGLWGWGEWWGLVWHVGRGAEPRALPSSRGARRRDLGFLGCLAFPRRGGKRCSVGPHQANLAPSWGRVGRGRVASDPTETVTVESFTRGPGRVPLSESVSSHDLVLEGARAVAKCKWKASLSASAPTPPGFQPLPSLLFWRLPGCCCCTLRPSCGCPVRRKLDGGEDFTESN